MGLYKVECGTDQEIITEKWDDAFFQGRKKGDKIYKWHKGVRYLVLTQSKDISFGRYLPTW